MLSLAVKMIMDVWLEVRGPLPTAPLPGHPHLQAISNW